MNNTPLVIERVYNCSVQRVWKSLTDIGDLRQWYFNLSGFRAEPGFEFSFYGEGKNGEKYLHLCKVTEVVVERKLAYSWQYDGVPGLSHVTFELFADAKQTRLKLTHSGLESFPQDRSDFARENFMEGWSYITGTALKKFLEKEPADSKD